MKRIAVKELAYFVCQSGNLTSEFFSNHDLEQGTKIHQYLQNKYNDKSLKEYYIKNEISYNDTKVLLHGFIDGVLNINNETIIEEIKSTTLDLEDLTLEYHKEHLAQLKIYAYMYAIQNNMDKIHIRLTYASTVNYETRKFDLIENVDDLEAFVFELLEEYLKWLAMLDKSEEDKIKTIKEIEFPFKNRRQGQRELMKAVYETMNQKKEILYAVAPTGIGKTMATIFPSLKTLKKNEKLFYATAKGSGKNAPLEAIKLLKEKGLKLKTIDITAKSKICNCNKKNCDPDDCPFAQNYFDKLKSATYDIFESTDIYDKENILEFANKHKVCAFEFSLYLSYFCDLVIADYNYVFDPHAQLIRYFQDDTYKIKVLVDEAHNLISRSKEMYSSVISTEDLRTLRRHTNGLKPSARNDCNKAIEIMESYREKMAEGAILVDDSQDYNLVIIVKNLISKVEEILRENKKIQGRDNIYDVYHKLQAFSNASEYFSANHKYLAKLYDDEIYVHLYCLDASDFLLDTINSSVEDIVFFSATMTPIKYHSDLLTKGEGKIVELPSPFNPNNLDIIINDRISTKYNNRANSVDQIIETIEILSTTKKGNYIVFFPSYKYMQLVLDALEEPLFEVIVQESETSDKERLQIIEEFKTESLHSRVGFFVMGGVFSEGIDLIGDALNGVIIVGVGLPMICDENNILKEHFQNVYNQGFEYAYMYPGFNKVVQAVGRVIRSDTDRGIAILLDERFNFSNYKQIMPSHWSNKKIISSSYVLKKEIESFYKK
jgi:DNA excision repair protein ERCC-2